MAVMRVRGLFPVTYLLFAKALSAGRPMPFVRDGYALTKCEPCTPVGQYDDSGAISAVLSVHKS